MIHGLAAALEALGPGDAPPEQDDLFDPPASLPLPPAAKPGAKGGRPPGRRNKRTEEWVRLIEARYASPLIGLCETYTRPVDELARALKLYRRNAAGDVVYENGEPVLELGEAFKMQMAAMNAALPYLHQRLPQAVEITPGDRNVGVVVIGDLSGGDGGAGLALPLADVEENQGLTIDHDPKSDGRKSDGRANPLDGNDD